MNSLDLYPHQIEGLNKLRNGTILNGDVGSGKSRTAIAYYYTKVVQGTLRINDEGMFQKPKLNIPLYIITTAKKRDGKDWEQEMLPFSLSTNETESICHLKVVVDSWNNIKKYTEIQQAFFIFDEDRVTGSGQWVRSFLKITKNNQWIILSASPGDQWSDYIPVFIANGFYKNKTEFNRLHVIFNRYTNFPMIDHYVNIKRLEKERQEILISMVFERKTKHINQVVRTEYDREKYRIIQKDRWDPYDNVPIENISKLCYLLKKVCNSDPSRKEEVTNLTRWHDRCIIFYNFDYELKDLKEIAEFRNLPYGEWNGHCHQEIPKGDHWLYFVQYAAGAEGWNCISTDTMIFFSQNYSYKTMEQSQGRIDRMNTPFKDLYYYHLKSKSPIDLAITRALNRKQKFNESRYFARFDSREKHMV